MKKPDRSIRRPASKEVKPVSRGQAAFRALTATPKAIAEALGCTGAEVSQWRSGARTPSAPKRAKIEAVYDIAHDDWDLDVDGASARVDLDDAPAGSVPTTIAKADQHIADIERELAVAGLSADARARFRGELTRALTLRGRLEKDQSLFEHAAIVGSPWYQRCRLAILRALAKFPEASAAVEDALAAVDELARVRA